MSPFVNPYRFAGGGGCSWPGGITPQEYDGVNDWNSATLRAGTSAKQTSLSFWLNPHAMDSTGARYIFQKAAVFASTYSYELYLSPNGGGYQLAMISTFFNGKPTIQLSFETTSNIFSQNDDNWYHILVRSDVTTDNGNQVYVNDVDAPLTKTTRANNANFGFTDSTATYSMGTQSSSAVKACVAQFWASNGDTTALDWDVESNRRKFIDASGCPVDLGSDGSTPTGAPPAFFRGNGNLAVNDGLRGNLALTGSLVDCTGSALS